MTLSDRGEAREAGEGGGEKEGGNFEQSQMLGYTVQLGGGRYFLISGPCTSLVLGEFRPGKSSICINHGT